VVSTICGILFHSIGCGAIAIGGCVVITAELFNSRTGGSEFLLRDSQDHPEIVGVLEALQREKLD
jgi:hypothetical protein